MRSESILIKVKSKMVKAHKLEPPYEKKGNGMPITGAKPMVIPMLMAK
jgi:hypothetical protein